MYANNEVGSTTQLATAARSAVPLHTDAVQAAGQVTLDVQTLGVDMLSISAHKFYGPKGVGALYVRDGIELVPSQSGGGHESGRRAGTHNTSFIVGMARALQLAYEERDERVAHYRQVRDQLIDGVLSRIPDAQLTGHPVQRLASHASFVFAAGQQPVVMHLDLRGVAASGGSACKTGNPEPSAVLLAMGYTPEQATGSLRLSVGQQTTAEEVDYALNVLVESVEKVRKLNGEWVR
jgi:cysteine desulfurase